MAEKLHSRDGSIHVTDEKINTITALIGAMLSVVGVPFLVLSAFQQQHSWPVIVQLTIYGITLINLFMMSLVLADHVNWITAEPGFDAIYHHVVASFL